jgi:TetR/AcrR family transcriptional repressor of nem operon
VRVSKEKAAENRARILTEAARLFRERGLSGVGVDALTEAAGLTHGSLYSQFGSKERLAAEAMKVAIAGSALARIPEDAGPDALAGIVASYLSTAHRDRPGKGCTFAALGCEVARQGPALRKAFTEGVRVAVGRLATLLPGSRRKMREDRALALLSGMVGALMLSRAVDDPALSEQILAATARELSVASH